MILPTLSLQDKAEEMLNLTEAYIEFYNKTRCMG